MNTTSFQSSVYKHSFQSNVHGQSGLKIMDGEDLSTFIYLLLKPLEIVKEFNNFSQMRGGNSKWTKNSERKICKEPRKKSLISKLNRSTI